jgi:hypothetical protein
MFQGSAICGPTRLVQFLLWKGNDMAETKPWYYSRTIWASLVTVASAFAGIVGLPVEGLDNSVLTDTLLQLVTAVAGAVSIFGRLSAKDRIS